MRLIRSDASGGVDGFGTIGGGWGIGIWFAATYGFGNGMGGLAVIGVWNWGFMGRIGITMFGRGTKTAPVCVSGISGHSESCIPLTLFSSLPCPEHHANQKEDDKYDNSYKGDDENWHSGCHVCATKVGSTIATSGGNFISMRCLAVLSGASNQITRKL